MRYEIILEHREQKDIKLYHYDVNCRLDIFREWLVNFVSPVTINQWYYDDKPTCRPPEDIIVIGLRCELGELYVRPVEEAKVIQFYKGLWYVP